MTVLGGPWTRHGHEIPGVTVAGADRPPIARCGGPGLCRKCAEDVTQAAHPIAIDHQLIEHIRTGGAPDPADRLAVHLAAYRDAVQA